ncbi:hypothetical protein GUJ93_ZPchr0004g40039 [Zizania palustris]|uniref:Uncharacterized protein n=1 Tax=Zizania palustris TaxID=103762 RepID=A0A8J5SCT0_ZIZPA|nr:hypothetical protein GUJ93_ZPchr0004g40039 [Zizania palustris]
MIKSYCSSETNLLFLRHNTRRHLKTMPVLPTQLSASASTVWGASVLQRRLLSTAQPLVHVPPPFRLTRSRPSHQVASASQPAFRDAASHLLGPRRR